MTYKDYKGFTKKYVVVHVTGTGVMEDNFIDHDVVWETDEKEEAYMKANELTLKYNSIADIESTWYNNRYHVHINTLSEMDKNVMDSFQQEFEERLRRGLKEGRYDKCQIGDITCYMDNRLPSLRTNTLTEGERLIEIKPQYEERE